MESFKIRTAHSITVSGCEKHVQQNHAADGNTSRRSNTPERYRIDRHDLRAHVGPPLRSSCLQQAQLDPKAGPPCPISDSELGPAGCAL